MPGMNGLEILKEAKQINPETDAVLMTAYGTIETAVAAMKAGARDYITKPIDLDELSILIIYIADHRALAKENEILRQQLKAKGITPDIIKYEGRKMADLIGLVMRIAPSQATVLIQGETGTGKELFARLIHHASPRAERPFITVNCAAIPETLLESELFGHERGAFTGAVAQRRGRFELAHGGTLFLDEVGEMSPALQAKLLRVLQEGTLERVGGTKTVTVDVRVIAATNRDMQRMVADRTFREDVYYRLSVFPINIPPLRERRADILPLANHILTQASRRFGKRIAGFSDEATVLLHAYAWPGNIRELQNVIERAAILCREDHILPAHLNLSPVPGASAPTVPKTLREMEREAILAALAAHDGNRRKAAEQLGLGLRTLYARLREYGMASGIEEED
jgi:DNA-binding NtrC family response regulator